MTAITLKTHPQKHAALLAHMKVRDSHVEVRFAHDAKSKEPLGQARRGGEKVDSFVACWATSSRFDFGRLFLFCVRHAAD
jgi:hypothetical protein